MAGKKQAQNLTPEQRLSQALVPEKEWPYPLPENWRWVRLGEIAEITMGQSPKGEDTTEEKTEFGLIGGAADMGKLYPQITRYTYKPTKLSRKDDIILSIRATLGRPILSDGVYCLGRGVAAISSVYVSRMLLRLFFINFEQYLYDVSTGSTFAQVNSSQLKNMFFPLPPLSEQERIVNKIESLFTKLDEAKEKTEAVVDGFENRKAAILHQAFSGQLTEKWRQEHGVKKESWREKKIGELCVVNPSKIDTKGLPDEIEVSFYPMASVSDLYGEVVEPKTRKLKEVRKGFTNFVEGDVVFAKITPCMENGKSAIIKKLVNDIGYGTTEFYVLRCNEKLFNRYLYHLVRSRVFRERAKAVMVGAVGQQRVPKSFLEEYKISIPSFEEQIEIVRLLDDFLAKEERAKELAENVIEQIELMKKSILARAFRGELGTNQPEEENAEEMLSKGWK